MTEETSRPARRPGAVVLAAAAFGLFLVWSNSFVAVEYLLEPPAERFDWLSLTVARFVPAALVCGLYLGWRRRREAWQVASGHPLRLLACAALAVPLYNFALGFGQEHGVPAPIASLTTTLAPLFILVLATVFLGERPSRRMLAGFALALAGMVVLAVARSTEGATGYVAALVTAAGAPLSWACFSVLSKPLTERVSPVVWSYLATALGGVMVLPLLPGAVWEQWSRLDASGWGALLYLSLPCTVLGFALWTWLLRYLPAFVVGLLVFLNPPLTTISKKVLAALWPATFDFSILPGEWWGGAVVLVGLAVALIRRPGARRA